MKKVKDILSWVAAVVLLGLMSVGAALLIWDLNQRMAKPPTVESKIVAETEEIVTVYAFTDVCYVRLDDENPQHFINRVTKELDAAITAGGNGCEIALTYNGSDLEGITSARIVTKVTVKKEVKK